VTSAELILGIVTLQRAAELLISSHTTSKLMACGAVEVARRHYPLIVAVHAAWLIAFLLFYLILQGLRFWVMWTLGRRWTTRIIVLPDQPLVSAGPYRFLPHPNYAVVAGEIAVLPLALHLPWLAILFTILNAVVLAIRIPAENRALVFASSRQTTLGVR
jgi:methyltransferase